MTPLTDTLVVATKDRAADVEALLRHLGGVEPLPLRIVVVDASTDDVTASVCRSVDVPSAVAARLTYVRATRTGLASQRNQALTLVDTDIVHFLDDDSRPEADYFAQVVAFFSADTRQRVGAVTGLVTNPGPRRRTTLVHRLFLLDPKPGQLNRAGRNAVLRDESAPRPVDCLSGCCMSFRRTVLEGLTFDERLQEGITGGYALGEDLDMGLQVARRAQLWCVPQARLAHEESPQNRAKALAYEHAASAFRLRLACDPCAPVTRLGFAWATLGDALLATVSSVTGGGTEGLARARAVLRGARDRRVCLRPTDCPRFD